MATAVQTRLSAGRDSPIARAGSVRFSRTPERHYLDPNAARPRTPADFKREPSPFELGDSVDLNIASQNAIIDKALVMDISGGNCRNVDEYIQLFMTEYCVIDRACFEDVSSPDVKIVIVEEDEEQEKKRTGFMYKAPEPIKEEEEESQFEAKKKLRLMLLLLQ